MIHFVNKDRPSLPTLHLGGVSLQHQDISAEGFEPTILVARRVPNGLPTSGFIGSIPGIMNVTFGDSAG